MKKMLIGIIRLYQRLISPLFPRHCRFHPTCSEYTVLALQKYGLGKGGYLALKRIVKCNPFNPGGYDPV